MVSEMLHICKLFALVGSRLSGFKMYLHSFSFTTAVAALIHELSTSFAIKMRTFVLAGRMVGVQKQPRYTGLALPSQLNCALLWWQVE